MLCLLVLPGGEILSGSGDTTVKMWAPGGGPCIHTIKAHTDTVRCGSGAGLQALWSRVSWATLQLQGWACPWLASASDTWLPSRCGGAPPAHDSSSPCVVFGMWCRGMCLVPGLGFATASHDMSIKVRRAALAGGRAQQWQVEA